MNSSPEISRTLKLLHTQGSPREAKVQDHDLTNQNDIVPTPQLRKEDPREGAGRFRRRQRWTAALSLTTMRSFMVRRRWERILLPVLGTVVSVDMTRTVVSPSYLTTMRSPMAGRKLERVQEVRDPAPGTRTSDTRTRARQLQALMTPMRRSTSSEDGSARRSSQYVVLNFGTSEAPRTTIWCLLACIYVNLTSEESDDFIREVQWPLGLLSVVQ
jgi:hypothetical protein